MAKRARGAEGGVSIRGEDGQFRQKSWKEISPELSSSADEDVQIPASGAAPLPNAGSDMADSQRHGHEDEATDYGGGGELGNEGDGVEAAGGHSAREEQQPSFLDTYVHQLLSIRRECVPPLVPSGLEQAAQQGENTFCLPGFDEGKGRLTYDSFAMPGLRRVPLVEGGFGVAYWCTCCPELELQKCIFSGLADGQQEKAFLNDQAPQCLHLGAVLKLGGAVNLDGISLCLLRESRPEEGSGDDEGPAESLFVLPFRGNAPKAILVGTAASGCVVVVEKSPGRWNCTHCFGKGKQKCWHVQAVMGSQTEASEVTSRMTAEEFEEQFKGDFDRSTGKRRLKCLSRASIPEAHKADPALAETLLRRGRGELAFPTQCVVEADEGAPCKKCGRLCSASEVDWKDGTIFHLSAPIKTRVQVRRCACGEKWSFDGRSNGILNFNNKYLYSYEILSWYANQMWRTKLPFVTMWWTVLSMYAGAGIDKATLQPFVNQRQTFQDAFFDYITLLDIDYSASFKCKCARPEGCLEIDFEPTELIGDGITLGYRGDLSYFISPYTIDNNAALKTGSLHQHRTFVTDPHIRSLLLRFSHAPNKSAVGLSEVELTQLQDLVEQSSAKHFAFLLVDRREQEGKYYSKQEYAEFLRAASVPQAAAVLLPRSIEPIVEHLLNPEKRKFATLSQSRELAERAPVLSRFVQNQLAYGGNQLSDDALCLLDDLLTVARKAYVEEPVDIFRKLKRRKPMEAPLDQETKDVPNLASMSAEEQFLRTGHFFPNQPIHRPLPPYAADAFSQKVGPACTKYKNKHANLTPGLYPIFCIHCAMCLGFVVLANADSPSVVFRVLFTRWRRLKRFIYDNVCNLFAYALNREAVWAGGIHWLIDRLHAPNHKDCSPAFSIARYAALQSVNSQRSEQKNSRLVNAKTQAAYMKQINFLHYVRFFLYSLNKQQELGNAHVLPHLQ